MRLISSEEQDFRETSIGKLPKDWKIVRISDVAEINNKSINPEKELSNSEFYYIDIDSVEAGSGVINSPKKLLGKNAPSRARRIVHENDIIMSTVRPYLKSFALIPKAYDGQICSTGFAVLTCKKEITPHYLLSMLFSEIVISQCNRMMVGGQYPALNSSQVSNIMIPLPPLSEQLGISEILSIVNLTIQKTDEINAKAENLKKGLMQKVFTQGIGHKEFKDTKIGKLPKDWNIIEFGRIAIKVQNGLYKGKDFLGSGYGFVRMTELFENDILTPTKDILRIRVNQKEIEQFSLKEDDLLFARTSLKAENTGKCVFVPKMEEKLLFESNIIRIRINQSLAFPKFYFYWFNSPIGRQQLVRGIRTVAASIITSTDLKNLEVPLPPDIKEQSQIAGILSTVEENIELTKREKQGFTKIKQGLMDLLLTGIVRVKVD